jgi:hypothetical protein
MARDIELVRKILLAIASSDRPLDSALVRIVGFTPDQILDHIRQLQEAQMLAGIIATGADRRQRYEELRLTWAGHEFLDAARNEKVWRAAVAEMKDEEGAKPLSAWKTTLLRVYSEIYAEDSSGE